MSKEFNYNQVTTEEGTYYCLKSVADFLEVSYDTVYYHVKNKGKIFTPFIRSFEVVSNNGKKREQLFLKVPEAIMELSRCITKLRFSPGMNDIMKLSLDVQQGDLKVAKIEDIDYLKCNYNELLNKYNNKRSENINVMQELNTVYLQLIQEKTKSLGLHSKDNEITRLKKQLDEKECEIKELKELLNERAKKITSLYRQIEENSDFKALKKEKASMKKDLRAKEVTIDSLKNQLIQVREYYKEKLRVMEGKLQGKKTVKNPSLLHFT